MSTVFNMLPPDREATHQSVVETSIVTLHSHLRGDTHHHLHHLHIEIVTSAHLHMIKIVTSAHLRIIEIVMSAHLPIIEIIMSAHLHIIEIVTSALLHIKIVTSALLIIEIMAFFTSLIIMVVVRHNGPPTEI